MSRLPLSYREYFGPPEKVYFTSWRPVHNPVMIKSQINFDKKYLAELYAKSEEILLEMAAPSYLHTNPLIRFIVGWRMQTAVSFLNMGATSNMLDFGCGAGILFLQLPQQNHDYYGVELELWPAEQMLSHHKRHNVKLFHSSTWQAEIADHTLDNLSALEVLEHVEDLSELLLAFKKKLKPSGRLVISGPTENAAYKIARKISGFSGDYHVRDIFAIREAVKKAGFVRERLAELPLPGPLCLFTVEQYAPS